MAAMSQRLIKGHCKSFDNSLNSSRQQPKWPSYQVCPGCSDNLVELVHLLWRKQIRDWCQVQVWNWIESVLSASMIIICKPARYKCTWVDPTTQGPAGLSSHNIIGSRTSDLIILESYLWYKLQPDLKYIQSVSKHSFYSCYQLFTRDFSETADLFLELEKGFVLDLHLSNDS